MNKKNIKKIVFISYLVILVYKYFSSTLLSQQTHPPLLYPNLNILYWTFIISNLTDIFNYQWLKYLLDISLFTSCILTLVNIKSNIYPIIFSVSLWFYQFLYFSIVAYQPFAIGLLFPCLPFIFKSEIKFFIAYNFGRYFLCWLYFFAGVLKIINQGIFNINQLTDSIKISAADFIFYNPNHIKTQIMAFLIENIYLSYSLFISAVIIELTFFIGFLTKKYDLHLAVLFLTFHLINYQILDLPFINHAIIVTFFLPLKNSLNYSSS